MLREHLHFGSVFTCGLLCVALLAGVGINQVRAWASGADARQQTNDAYMSYLPVVFDNYSDIETGKIVFGSTRDGNDEIYSMNYDGSGVTRLTYDDSEDLSPDWSPDGSKIAFDSDRNGEFQIYVMNADGSDQTQITTLPDCTQPQWSPDGSRIAFVSMQFSNSIVYTMNPDGSDLFQVTDPALFGNAPYWSPDGTQIAFQSGKAIYVVNSDGSDPLLLVEVTGLVYFAWSPDGTEFVLSKATSPMFNFDLYLYDIASGITTQLTDSSFNHNSVDWSPDGRYLIFHSSMVTPANWEIYTLSVDGGNLQNLTNDPAADSEPDWVK